MRLVCLKSKKRTVTQGSGCSAVSLLPYQQGHICCRAAANIAANSQHAPKTLHHTWARTTQSNGSQSAVLIVKLHTVFTHTGHSFSSASNTTRQHTHGQNQPLSMTCWTSAGPQLIASIICSFLGRRNCVTNCG